jgi:hypothetical protein
MDFHEAIRALTGLAPFAPPPQFDPQEMVQPEFLPGSQEQMIEDDIVARGWDWHLARIETETGLLLLTRRSDPTEMTLCMNWLAPRVYQRVMSDELRVKERVG